MVKWSEKDIYFNEYFFPSAKANDFLRRRLRKRENEETRAGRLRFAPHLSQLGFRQVNWHAIVGNHGQGSPLAHAAIDGSALGCVTNNSGLLGAIFGGKISIHSK